jgi:hypothetical protein
MKIQQLAGPIAGVLCLALLLVLWRDHPAEAKAVPAVVRAKAFVLVDKHGVVRAQLNVETGGQVVFRLRDERGQIRAKFGADESGSGLLLLDEDTEPGVHILAQRSGTSITVRRGGQQTVLRPGG